MPVSLILYCFNDQPKLMCRPYRSRTCISSFVAMYTFRYTNGLNVKSRLCSDPFRDRRLYALLQYYCIILTFVCTWNDPGYPNLSSDLCNHQCLQLLRAGRPGLRKSARRETHKLRVSEWRSFCSSSCFSFAFPYLNSEYF